MGPPGTREGPAQQHKPPQQVQQQQQQQQSSSGSSKAMGRPSVKRQLSLSSQDCASNSSNNLYSVLGVPLYSATPDSIRMAYRRLARLFHPDRHRGNEAKEAKAKQKFQAIQGAYEVLSDRSRRQQYDLWLLEYLDVVDYLEVFKGFTLTVCGLGMDSTRLYAYDDFGAGSSSCAPEAVAS